MKHSWSITILHPNFKPKLGHGNMIEQEGGPDNSDLIRDLIDEHKAQSRVDYFYDWEDYTDEIRIWCHRMGQTRRTLINIQHEGTTDDVSHSQP